MSLAFASVAFVTALVVMTAGTILLIVKSSADRSVSELLRQKAEIVSYMLVERVRSHLEPVAAQAAFIKRVFGEMDLDAASADEIGVRLLASMAAVPQISSTALVYEDITLLRTFRSQPSRGVVRNDWSDDAGFSRMIRTALTMDDPYWGPFFVAEPTGSTLLNFLTPARDRTGTKYVIVSSVALDELSGFLKSLQNEMTGEAFILFGRDAVLASPALDADVISRSDEAPLPLLSELSDTQLRHIWSSERLQDIEATLANDIEARVVRAEGETIVFLFREIAGFGASPWYVGSYFPLERLSTHLTRNRITLVTSLVIIGLAAVTSFYFSRLVSGRIRELAVAARNISNWRRPGGIDLPRSVFTEINEVNRAFRLATRAFESLHAYVPKTLARRLIERGHPTSIESEEHDITVMFTDIVDFTGLAEERSPEEVVRFLNEHFTLLAQCIEAEHGIVDKFIGDATMAFWGGLESDEDHAVHACRAALRIAESMHHENGRRRATGHAPVRLRVGIHSGKAMVGNIGSSGRINYTVIGDSVNTSERLERLARDIGDPDAEVLTMISGDTAMRLGQEFLISPIGRKVLHGRHDETEVFILKAGHVGTMTEPAANPPGG